MLPKYYLRGGKGSEVEVGTQVSAEVKDNNKTKGKKGLNTLDFLGLSLL
jgi:hypothetical protein